MSSVPGDGRRETSVLPLQWVTVTGPSMVPTLRPGDRLLVRRGGRARPGVVVLARFPDLPGRLVVKRLARWTAAGAVLASDNAAASGDSRTHGPGEVLGRAVLVVRAGRPRRVAPAPDLDDGL